MLIGSVKTFHQNVPCKLKWNRLLNLLFYPLLLNRLKANFSWPLLVPRTAMWTSGVPLLSFCLWGSSKCNSSHLHRQSGKEPQTICPSLVLPGHGTLNPVTCLGFSLMWNTWCLSKVCQQIPSAPLKFQEPYLWGRLHQKPKRLWNNSGLANCATARNYDDFFLGFRLVKIQSLDNVVYMRCYKMEVLEEFCTWRGQERNPGQKGGGTVPEPPDSSPSHVQPLVHISVGSDAALSALDHSVTLECIAFLQL